MAALGMEIHALSSATKPLCAWTARDAIQDCRESCGGHGYLKGKFSIFYLFYFLTKFKMTRTNILLNCFILVSRLGILRQEHDANCTYEGESNVLIQQASQWLLGQYSNVLKGNRVLSPLGTASFLDDSENILRWTFNHYTVEETLKPEMQNVQVQINLSLQ